MELDKRIIEGKKPLDCFDTENSEVLKPFLQKEGYFSNNLRNFLNLNSCKKGCLVNVFAKNFDCFVCFADDSNSSYKFFIPEAWVKPEEPEKKYRPYSLEEFLAIFSMGNRIGFKGKGCCDEVKVAMFTGYMTDVDRTDDKTPGACEVMLGIFHYSLLSLFEDFELFYNGKWQPFGVIDE